jgi:hypothetical protein
MRTIIPAIVVGLACLAGGQPDRAEDKEEKKHREQLEKKLAKIEPTLEKEKWAVENKKDIAKLAEHLNKAGRIDLLRVNPRAIPKGTKPKKKAFHGYEILFEVQIEAKQRKQAADFLGKTFHWNEVRKAACFHPRHGLRAISGKRTLEFLICFECNRVEVFEGGKCVENLPLGFTDKKNPIEQIITDHEKKARERK